jgi:hypothetical protein
MPDLFEIAANERETVRVFAVDLPPVEAKPWLGDPDTIEASLGVALDHAHVEFFPAEDLKGLGLTQFLIDGYGIAEAEIAPHRTRLDDAGPYLLLLRARAFGGAALRLRPKPPLVPLGAYAQAGTEVAPPMPPRETAPGPAAPAPDAPVPPAAKSPLIALLIFLGLAVALILILLIPKL